MTERSTNPAFDGFANRGLGIRGMLQTVEDTLIEAGFDEFTVETQHGSFKWVTAKQARAQAEEALVQAIQALGRRGEHRPITQ